MADPGLRAHLSYEKIAKTIPLPPGNIRCVDDKTAVLTGTLLLTAAKLLYRLLLDARNDRPVGVRPRRERRGFMRDGRRGRIKINGYVLLRNIEVCRDP